MYFVDYHPPYANVTWIINKASTAKETEGQDSASALRWANYIELGTTRYILNQPLRGEFGLGGEGYLLKMELLAPTFVGEGVQVSEAERDLKCKIHAAFQYLYGMRRFQMTADDQKTWGVLQEAIDVSAYRSQTPIHTQEVGRVDWERHNPIGRGYLRVLWIDGRSERVFFEQAPGELAGYRPPQWFQATVERDPFGNLVSIITCERIDPLTPMTNEEAQRYLDNISGIGRLPVFEGGRPG